MVAQVRGATFDLSPPDEPRNAGVRRCAIAGEAGTPAGGRNDDLVHAALADVERWCAQAGTIPSPEAYLTQLRDRGRLILPPVSDDLDLDPGDDHDTTT